MNRDHSIIFEIAPKYCISDSCWYEDYSILLRDFFPTVVVIIVICVHAQSFLTLCDPMDCRPPGYSVHGISQARILKCVSISYSTRYLPDPGIKLMSPALAGKFFYHCTIWNTDIMIIWIKVAHCNPFYFTDSWNTYVHSYHLVWPLPIYLDSWT